jgi:hypothetical protein
MYAEFVACYEATGQVKWLMKFVPGLKVVDSIQRPLKLYCDNESAVFYAHNNKSSGAAKYIDIKFYVVKERIQDHTTHKRLTTQCVQRTLSRHGFMGKPMNPGQ